MYFSNEIAERFRYLHLVWRNVRGFIHFRLCFACNCFFEMVRNFWLGPLWQGQAMNLAPLRFEPPSTSKHKLLF